MAWPLIAKAITTDEQGFYVEPSTTEGRVLVASGGPKLPATPVKPKQSRNGTLERIAQCESQNNPLARNPRSTAKGRFQFLDSSWRYYGTMKWGSLEGKDVFSYEDNTELAEWVYEREGTAPWEASRHCWG